MTVDYNSYLEYIRNKYDELASKKEKSKNKALAKKMKDFITEEHVIELKSKFAEAIELVSTKEELEK